MSPSATTRSSRTRQLAGRWVARLQKVYARVLPRISPRFAAKAKRLDELTFWRIVRSKAQTLDHHGLTRYYTEHFGLELSFYSGKRILDIGCGPRGSLEWADMAEQRVGLDPLADDYRELGVGQHAMDYVTAPAEDIPFPEAHFDVVTAFNSFDHVDDLEKVVAEIARVTKPGGLFLLITEVDHAPTITEPQSFSWDILDRLRPHWAVRRNQRFEHRSGGIYESMGAAQPYDDGDPERRPGLLSAMLERRGGRDA